MKRVLAFLFLVAALAYLVFPGDLDFVPVVGRLDDIVLLTLAVLNWWRQTGRGKDGARRGVEAPGAGGETQDPCSVLGVPEDAGEEQIKKAYRELLGRYHPDRLQHFGEEFRTLAARRTVQINAAYDRLKRERNFS